MLRRSTGYLQIFRSIMNYLGKGILKYFDLKALFKKPYNFNPKFHCTDGNIFQAA